MFSRRWGEGQGEGREEGLIMEQEEAFGNDGCVHYFNRDCTHIFNLTNTNNLNMKFLLITPQAISKM